MPGARRILFIVKLNDSKALLRALAALAAIIPSVAPHSAVSATGPAVCTFTVPVAYSPALSATNGQGRFESELSAGTLQCVGVAEGIVNPTGTVSVYGWYGYDTPFGPESCAAGSGSFGFNFHIPVGGPGNGIGGSYVRAGARAVFGPVLGALPPVQGTFEVIPEDGQDCTNVPIASAVFSGVFRIL